MRMLNHTRLNLTSTCPEVGGGKVVNSAIPGILAYTKMAFTPALNSPNPGFLQLNGGGGNTVNNL